MAKTIKLEIKNGAEVLLTTAFGLGENELIRRREVDNQIQKTFGLTDMTDEQFDALNAAFDNYRDFTKALISLLEKEERKIEKIESILKKDES